MRGGWGPLTAGSLVGVIQAVGVSVTLEALGDAVAAATLEVTRVAGPELWNTAKQSLSATGLNYTAAAN